MALGTRAFICLASLLAASSIWLTSCSLNPQPEPPMDEFSATGGSGGTLNADAGKGGHSTGGAAGEPGAGGAAGMGGYAGMSQGGGGGSGVADASTDACEGDDCKCGGNGDGGPCDATCENPGDSDAACGLDGGCEASGNDAMEPDAEPADVVSGN
jgi:hypothetical protein